MVTRRIPTRPPTPWEPYQAKAIDAALEAKNNRQDEATVIEAARSAAAKELGVESLELVPDIWVHVLAAEVLQNRLRSSTPSSNDSVRLTTLVLGRIQARQTLQREQAPPAAEAPSGNPQQEAANPMVDQADGESTIPAEDQLCNELEKLSKAGEVNAALVVRLYREKLSERPILTLVKQVNERIGIYHNLLEAVKREPLQDPPANPSTAQRLKIQYEGLNLVPPGHLPNPWALEIADFAMKKLRRYGSLLLELVAQYADDISRELKVSPEVTILFEVGMGLSPEVTIGIERSGSMKRVV